MIWDLHDTGPDHADALSLTAAELLASHVGGHASTPALTSIFSFGYALRQDHPMQAAALDALWSREAMAAPVDPWGTGETNDAGIPALCDPALFPDLRPGDAILLDRLPASSGVGNRAGDHRYLRLDTEGAALRIDADSGEDIDLRVWDHGVEICESLRTDGEESCDLPAGLTEVVVELDLRWVNLSTHATVIITPAEGVP